MVWMCEKETKEHDYHAIKEYFCWNALTFCSNKALQFGEYYIAYDKTVLR